MKMGFEGLMYYGTAGSTADTLISNRVDVAFDTDPQMAPTTVAGAGTSPPIDTEGVCTLKWSATLKMRNDPSDAVLAALRAAAAAGGAVAIRMKDYSAGKGYDGDCNVKMAYGGALSAEQTFDFTFSPNNALRTPQLYV